MGEAAVPNFMSQLLEQMGWDQGTRIPLADNDNQNLETLLIARHKEIQSLKEALAQQKEKQNDLDKYKDLIQTEYQENTRLMFARKQQMEQEVKLKQLSNNEVYSLERDILDYKKESSDINQRIDRFQKNIGLLLKKADALKFEVCNERGALREWRDTLERHAGDITSIEQFTKQDTTKAKALEEIRQKRKVEHDKMQERLNQLMADLNAEERACNRISVQVGEGLEQRKEMMAMWTGAVDNLRQRDTDIRHVREDYAVLEAECNHQVEMARQQQDFLEQQRVNNMEAERENVGLAHKLAQLRLELQTVAYDNITLDSEARSLQRELSNMQGILEKLRIQNRQIIDDQYKKELALESLLEKMEELKTKYAESNDRTKSAEMRAKQLEEMLIDEEKFASQLTASQQRVLHCSFVEQQRLLALQNEEKLFYMHYKAAKAMIGKLEAKEQQALRNLQSQKETLYSICYQVETIGARVSHMEGASSERDCSAELLEREERLKSVMARHAARVSLLERHSERLHDDMRRLAKEVNSLGEKHAKLKDRLTTALLNVEGGDKELHESRDEFRKLRVEEALTSLRVAQMERAVSGLDDTAFSLEKQRLQLDAAMRSRMVEVGCRRDVLGVQRRELREACGRLSADIRERVNRIDQLKKRYDILIASLGKDESGQQLSVTFFKIKFASERAELRERGAALDADICRRNKEVAAMEATLAVLQAAHTHFVTMTTPLDNQSPEVLELNAINKRYYELRDELKVLSPKLARVEDIVNRMSYRKTLLSDKQQQLEARRSEAECDLETGLERVAKNETLLGNAHEIVNTNVKRLRKYVKKDIEEWKFFQMSLWVRDYAEAAANAVQALKVLCEGNTQMTDRLAALIVATDAEKHVPAAQKRLLEFIKGVTVDTKELVSKTALKEMTESVFSTSVESTRSSIASGYTRRVDVFRRRLAEKLDEKIADDSGRRASVTINRVTLSMEMMPSNLIQIQEAPKFR